MEIRGKIAIVTGASGGIGEAVAQALSPRGDGGARGTRELGRVDIPVNNAGQGMRSPVEDIDLDDYREIVELNVFAVLESMQRAIPLMRRPPGHDGRHGRRSRHEDLRADRVGRGGGDDELTGCPYPESNRDQLVRSEPFYPLNYRGGRAA